MKEEDEKATTAVVHSFTPNDKEHYVIQRICRLMMTIMPS